MAASTRVVVSVDTEEDQWGPAREDLSVRNIRALSRFHELMERLNLRPTYFVSYQVANTPWAADVVRGLAADGAGEVAAHLQPWNTPPLTEPLSGRNSMLNNLSVPTQRKKLQTLTRRHEAVFGEAPVSFRAGRFGLGPGTVGPLIDLGYRVDSSVTPYFSWEAYDDGPSFTRASPEIYRLDRDRDNVEIPVPDGPLVEVPISCGFNRQPFERWSSIYAYLQNSVPWRFGAVGLVWRTGALRRIFLSPELHETKDLLTLSEHLLMRGTDFLHLMFHSSSLVPGLTPFTRTAADVDRLLGRIDEFVTGLARMTTPEPATVAEVAGVNTVRASIDT